MKKINLFLFVLLVSPHLIFSQETYSTLKNASGEIKIPGEWKQGNTIDDSGQTFFFNKEGVVIGIAKNPQKAYSFYKKNYSDFKNVQEFYKWDSDYRRENNFKTDKLKENAELKYVIWKYADEKGDNVYLFGTTDQYFLNLLVYSNLWNEEEKIKFLEHLYQINR